MCNINNVKYKMYNVLYVGTNGLSDLVLEDLMKIYEAIALEHVATMIKLMKM